MAFVNRCEPPNDIEVTVFYSRRRTAGLNAVGGRVNLRENQKPENLPMTNVKVVGYSQSTKRWTSVK